MGEISNAYKFVVDNPEGKCPLTRSRHRRCDKIKKVLEIYGVRAQTTFKWFR
jgi:hypothetical protein